MSQPIVTWVRRNGSGQILDQIALYRKGENPAIYPGRLSDDGAFVLVVRCHPDAAPHQLAASVGDRLAGHRGLPLGRSGCRRVPLA